jgi:ectoine hydroxylase-related dioxygenase (phytanoyl-CoA dioxygenase family)
MTATPLSPARSHGWLSQQDCDLADLRALVETTTRGEDYPFADRVEGNVLFYGERLAADTATEQGRKDVQAELARALMEGPGMVVFQGAFAGPVVDRATESFEALLAEQKARGVVAGDHFAKPGANDRLWGALEKLGVSAPEVFAEYYANDVLSLVSQAWLGPGYQVVSDLNVVNPGGAAQTGHRDYHLGFMDLELAAQYPTHVHRLSPVLTLQGAVAHCDMPVETGPTMYLPHSQKWLPGYLATALPEVQQYFTENYVQLPLEKGDAVFFNPALLHGAGHNRSADVRRMANLLQVSSAFGRALGTVDRERLSAAVYPALRALRAGGADEAALRNVVAASAEGYPFPTNLDLDQPVGSLTPQTQAELVWQALEEDWEPAALVEQLRAQSTRRLSGPA